MTSSIIIIAGPTATGKTDLAVSLASSIDAEVISADSMQVYRGLDIGTAKPTDEELRGIPHHLIDVVDPDEPFDAAEFVHRADTVIRDLFERNKRVLVVGGTGLYIRALFHGLQKAPKSDPDIRREFERQADQSGWPALHQALLKRDPETGKKLHPNDGVRILRALEVVESSGVPLSEWHKRHQFKEERYPHRYLALHINRNDLNARINTRVDRMMDAGFLEEVEGLLKRGYGADLKPMQGLGYRRLCQYLAGEMSLAEAVEKTKTDTRRFAKRQMTWFKKEPNLEWISPDLSKIASLIKN